MPDGNEVSQPSCCGGVREGQHQAGSFIPAHPPTLSVETLWGAWTSPPHVSKEMPLILLEWYQWRVSSKVITVPLTLMMLAEAIRGKQ